MLDQIKHIREITGASIKQIQEALDESGGDEAKTLEILRKKGQLIAQKKSSRSAEEGIIASYIHNNQKVGVLLDIRCETDFVARSEDFQKLAHELTLQIAAANPLYIKPVDVPEDQLKKETQLWREEFLKQAKPEKIIGQMVDGKLKKYFEEVVLLEQIYIKDQDKKVKELVSEAIAKLGENIIIKEFARFEI